ncbi:glycerate kinase [Fundicoccus sp. Sow4_D5]|uniref:glycerate kinase n=1 Tax=Fundicoccus sp. Sow4_D5 TaxID=3438782 RepID=UPI003F92C077
MKKFILAPDSFKESASAIEVCDAMEKGIRKVFQDEVEIVKLPMADGGEGTVQALVNSSHGRIEQLTVQNPLGKETIAEYGILGDNHTAVIEMASANGLHLLKIEERNPLTTSTYGTGELIKACLDQGIDNFILGIGGSATNDGGSGMAHALGIRFLDKNGNDLPPGGAALIDLATIDSSQVHPKLASANITIACDVNNPLCGFEGASAVFGPQKGATPAMVEELDQALFHYSEVIARTFDKHIRKFPGSGAAGGLGAGLLAFTDATLEPGIDIVIRESQLVDHVPGANYIFTGEGQIDFQTKFGKTPFGVIKTAKAVNPTIKAIALAGSLGEGYTTLYENGFDAIFSITPGASDLATLFKNAEENIEFTTEAICRLLK